MSFDYVLLIHYSDCSKEWKLEETFCKETRARSVQAELTRLPEVSYVSCLQVLDLDPWQLKLPTKTLKEVKSELASISASH